MVFRVYSHPKSDKTPIEKRWSDSYVSSVTRAGASLVVVPQTK